MMQMIRNIVAGLFVVGLIYLAVTTPEQNAPALSGFVVRVVDGDSLYLDSHEPQIRLWGVDAPERDEQGFTAATDELRRLADGKQLKCQEVDQDRYGRTVARCFLSDGREINRLMIESGTATEYRRFTKGFYSR